MNRNNKLATQLRPLLFWRTLRFEAESDGSGTNWLAAWPSPERDVEMAADNDNDAPPTAVELELNEDTAEALLRRITGAETTQAPDGRTIIIGGDVEFSSTTGRLVRAGTLIFADFTKRHPFSRTPRAGELLGARLQSGRVVRLDAKTRYRPRTTLPPPSSPAPVTGHAAYEARDELTAFLATIDPKWVRVLDLALSAKSLDDLGNLLNYKGDYARKAAKRDLRKAIAALEEAQEELVEKIAA